MAREGADDAVAAHSAQAAADGFGGEAEEQRHFGAAQGELYFAGFVCFVEWRFAGGGIACAVAAVVALGVGALGEDSQQRGDSGGGLRAAQFGGVLAGALDGVGEVLQEVFLQSRVARKHAMQARALKATQFAIRKRGGGASDRRGIAKRSQEVAGKQQRINLSRRRCKREFEHARNKVANKKRRRLAPAANRLTRTKAQARAVFMDKVGLRPTKHPPGSRMPPQTMPAHRVFAPGGIRLHRDGLIFRH